MEKKFIALNYNVPDTTGDIFIPGSLKKRDNIPVTKNFNGLQIGKIVDVQDSEKSALFTADIMENEIERVVGFYPAIGFKVLSSEKKDDGIRIIKEFELYEISLCNQPNVDKNIKPIL